MTGTTFAGETGSREVEAFARRHPSLVTVGRLGWVAKGVVYATVGILAVPIALDRFGSEIAGSGGQEASQLGAVSEIADTSFGEIALYVVALGLALYAAWRVVTLLLPAERSAGAWLTRAGYLVSAVVYAALAWSALSFARHGGGAGGSQSEDAKVERLTRDLMDRTGGRWLVAALGGVVVAVGVYFAVKGVRASFRDELEPKGVGPVGHGTIVTLGRIGWIGRAVVTGLVGWFLVRSAIRFRADEAKGIDGALREVTDSTFGAVVVGLAAVGLLLYGVFCIVSSPRQRLSGAD